MTTEKPCSTHPDAPHGFDRNGSHIAGHYVCECSGWTPPASIQEELRSVPERSRTTLEAADRIDDLTAKLDQYRVEYFQTLRERDALMEQVAALTKDAVSAERERVLDLLRELDYSPNCHLAIRIREGEIV